MTKPVKFWQFGCWNNLNIGRMEDVIDFMKKKLDEETKKRSAPDFLIISGDNYYPGKPSKTIEEKKKDDNTTKKKTIYIKKLRDGLNELPIDINIYMLLGNHDLETNKGKKDAEKNLYITESNIEDKKLENDDCKIIQLELETIAHRDRLEYFFFKSNRINNTLLLMIDTSIYEQDKEVEFYLPCYEEFFKHNKFYNDKEKPVASIENLRKYQLDEINKAINEAKEFITHLIIVGHHPIYQLKYKIKQKKDKSETKDKSENPLDHKSDIQVNFTPVLKEIQTLLLPTTVYYYLCSDLHLYQKGSITMNFKDTNPMIIHQYIVGSGGTELDPRVPPDLVEPDKTYTSKDGSITYIFEHEKCEYGFLECIIEKDSAPSFKFMPLETTPILSELPTQLPLAPPLSRRARRARSLSKPRSRSLSRRARSLSRRARSVGGKSKKNYKKTQKKNYRRIVRK